LNYVFVSKLWQSTQETRTQAATAFPAVDCRRFWEPGPDCHLVRATEQRRCYVSNDWACPLLEWRILQSAADDASARNDSRSANEYQDRCREVIYGLGGVAYRGKIASAISQLGGRPAGTGVIAVSARTRTEQHQGGERFVDLVVDPKDLCLANRRRLAWGQSGRYR